MKIALRIVGVLLGLLLVLGLAQLLASESGEVVVLTTRDAAGEEHGTRLWVVDYGGHPYLRAGAEIQGWYQRLLETPEVQMERDGRREVFTAVPAPEKSEGVNLLMLEKYGWADRFIGALFGREDSIPIRLEPR